MSSNVGNQDKVTKVKKPEIMTVRRGNEQDLF